MNTLEMSNEEIAGRLAKIKGRISDNYNLAGHDEYDSFDFAREDVVFLYSFLEEIKGRINNFLIQN